MINGTDAWSKVQDTVIQQNQTAINEETIVYRVVKVRWQDLITNIDNLTNSNTSSAIQVRKTIHFIFNIKMISYRISSSMHISLMDPVVILLYGILIFDMSISSIQQWSVPIINLL